ncbi:hypothetical protein R5R35_005654 [Gryllus longicercus]|uniref:Methylosome subunit pICln n=1 Tax=Gryllus longicercus TaxID=2509291 RepID=A0AAN9YZV3_9ORTH
MVVVTSFPPPTEGIKHQQPNTSACINQKEIGKGTLYITESRLSWVNGATGQGFSLEYPHIALHAVSRDLTAHPHECLYLMIDTNIEEPEPCNQEEDNEEEGSDLGLTEIRFIPDDKGMLDAMFHAMSACQALHPDPQESLSEEEDETFEDAEDDDGEYHLSGAGDTPIILNVERPASNGVNASDGNWEPMETEEGQFEDAEIEPEN